MASGRMSGCLIFQRPLICSTTSLESIRTSTSAEGSSSSAASRPAISPRYSATLLVAVPIDSERSATTTPSERTSAPYPAGPGLPREPPSASTTRRPATDLQPAVRGTDQNAATLLAAQHLVVGRRGRCPQFVAGQLQVATRAPPADEGGSTDAT